MALAFSKSAIPIFQSSEIDVGNTFTYVYTIPKDHLFHVYGAIDDFLIVTYIHNNIIYSGLVKDNPDEVIFADKIFKNERNESSSKI